MSTIPSPRPKGEDTICWRPERESHPRMEDLQSPAFLLRHRANEPILARVMPLRYLPIRETIHPTADDSAHRSQIQR